MLSLVGRVLDLQIKKVGQKGATPIPVDVKSSSRGSMQSLHLFLKERNLNHGIRLSLENFSANGAIETITLYAAVRVVEK